jgi:small subunit ribosomal protein S17
MELAKKNRRLKGTIVSDKMDKTVVVVVRRIKTHAKYHKQYATHKKYKVHDPKNEYHVGDVVIIGETRPFSKDKRWQVISKINKENISNLPEQI